MGSLLRDYGNTKIVEVIGWGLVIAARHSLLLHQPNDRMKIIPAHRRNYFVGKMILSLGWCNKSEH